MKSEWILIKGIDYSYYKKNINDFIYVEIHRCYNQQLAPICNDLELRKLYDIYNPDYYIDGDEEFVMNFYDRFLEKIDILKIFL